MNKRGPTLVEVVVIVAILAILAAIAVPCVIGIAESGADQTAEKQLTVYDQNGNVIEEYKGECTVWYSGDKVRVIIDGKETTYVNATVVVRE